MIKANLLLGLSLFFFISSVTAKDFPFIRGTDFSKLPPKQRAKLHESMTKVFLEMEKDEKYQKFYKSKYSSLDPIKFLDQISNLLVDQCFAEDGGNACLFGGWPSQRNGRCSVPWSAGSQAVASSMESRAYDRESYCGADNLFRCNPLIFGPGIDQGMVGDSFPNINGNRNNQAPYHAGICVDISNGYSGLSQRCQAASQRLDELRVQHNMVPWRETDFFNEENAAQFRALQGLVADRCRSNREQLNSDNMCSSLESSLGLTAVAVEAGKMEGLTPDQLFPQCAGLTTDEPTCDNEADDSFNNMLAAMRMLQGNRECNFQAVQAIDDESLGQMMEFTPGECRNPIQGLYKRGGIPEGGAAFSFYFHGANGPLGRISVPGITAATPPADIVRLISTQDNQEAFDRLCNNAVCPRTEEGHLGNLYQALDEIKGMENCSFGRVRAVDTPTNGMDFFEPSSCDLSIEGQLAGQGLPHTPDIRGLQQRVPITITLTNSQGEFLAAIPINAASDMNKSSFTSQLIESQQFQEACRQSASAYRTDDGAALPDVGISEGTFVPEFWGTRIADLRNVADQQGIEGFRVEVSDNGDLILHADDPTQIAANATDLMAVINNAPGPRDPSGLIEENGGYRVTNTPPDARVQAIAHRSGQILTTEERGHITAITDSLGQSDSDLTRIERDGSGVIRLTASTRLNEDLLGSSYEGYQVEQTVLSGGRGTTLITLTPVPEVREVSLADVITPTAEGIRVMRERAERAGPPTITLEDVQLAAPVPTIEVSPLPELRSPPATYHYSQVIDAEERIDRLVGDSFIDDNANNAALNLMYQVAQQAAVVSSTPVDGENAIDITVDFLVNGNTTGFSPAILERMQSQAVGGSTMRMISQENGRVVYRIFR